ncbi:MAG: hypothetical protein KY468_20615 [Armatimonadetes bacterium]|nr:hypothetical protein [Armatimonadota bacterium]
MNYRILLPLLLLVFPALPAKTAAPGKVKRTPASPPKPPVSRKPLFRDFMGLNVHTVQFKPELYRPVTRLLRDYHGMNWDVGDDPSRPTTFPMAHNGVDWGKLYGSWKEAGYRIDVSVMFSGIPQKAWKNVDQDAYQYGRAFARYFGPSGPHKLVEAVEIGNEPGFYDDPFYRALFENMAKGLRRGDPRLLISTCAVAPEPSGEYHKSIETVKGLEKLYDIINLHSYAQVEGYPTWRRSHPEDPDINFLKRIKDTLAWRDRNAPGKKIWVTEFGWDATTKPQAKEGIFKQWVGSTETEQARYIVRAYLVFSAMDVDRAYLFWFNDQDSASVHGSSGLTRHYQPKPSFHAVAHLQKTLGDYRFGRAVVQRPGDLYVYEFHHATDPKRRIWAVWSPTGKERRTEQTLTGLPGAVVSAERMPLKPGSAESVPWKSAGKRAVRLDVGESPVYLRLRLP